MPDTNISLRQYKEDLIKKGLLEGEDNMATEKGVKLDQGKPRIGLVLGGFPRALESVSGIGTFGANKYTDDGWQSVENGFKRYTDAMLRHWMAYNKGETNDPESELPHLAHFAWNALATLELKLREQEE